MATFSFYSFTFSCPLSSCNSISVV